MIHWAIYLGLPSPRIEPCLHSESYNWILDKQTGLIWNFFEKTLTLWVQHFFYLLRNILFEKNVLKLKNKPKNISLDHPSTILSLFFPNLDYYVSGDVTISPLLLWCYLVIPAPVVKSGGLELIIWHLTVRHCMQFIFTNGFSYLCLLVIDWREHRYAVLPSSNTWIKIQRLIIHIHLP